MDRTDRNEDTTSCTESHQKPPSHVGDAPERLTSIYVIRMGDDLAYKIGIGVNPRSRRNSLQVGVPFPLHLLGSIEIQESVADAVEDSLHKRYDATRMVGEWFGLPAGRTEKWFVRDVLEGASILARCKLVSRRLQAEQAA